jgi:hypothetical protein
VLVVALAPMAVLQAQLDHFYDFESSTIPGTVGFCHLGNPDAFELRRGILFQKYGQPGYVSYEYPAPPSTPCLSDGGAIDPALPKIAEARLRIQRSVDALGSAYFQIRDGKFGYLLLFGSAGPALSGGALIPIPTELEPFSVADWHTYRLEAGPDPEPPAAQTFDISIDGIHCAREHAFPATANFYNWGGGIWSDAIPPAQVEWDYVYFGQVIGPSAFQRGDADANASIEIADAIFSLGYLFRGEAAPACLDAGDANDDGFLDLTDAVYTLSNLFQGGPSFPPPSPECGQDPTQDGLACESSLACHGQ